MIIQCTSCKARYHYDETRFGGAAAKKIRCTKCSSVFEIKNPSITPAGEQKLEPGPEDFALDETGMTEPRRAKGIPGAPARAMPTVEPHAAAPPDRAPAAPSPLAPPHVGMSSAVLRTTDRVALPKTGAERRLHLPDAYRLSLACIAGPDSGRIFEIDKARVVIGRANADIVVADIQASRQHAAIEAMDDKVYLADLGSTNGTYVGDERITRTEIDNRTEFEIGTTTLMLIKTPVTLPGVG